MTVFAAIEMFSVIVTNPPQGTESFVSASVLT